MAGMGGSDSAITRHQLEGLCNESAKLKSMGVTNQVGSALDKGLGSYITRITTHVCLNSVFRQTMLHVFCKHIFVQVNFHALSFVRYFRAIIFFAHFKLDSFCPIKYFFIRMTFSQIDVTAQNAQNVYSTVLHENVHVHCKKHVKLNT